MRSIPEGMRHSTFLDIEGWQWIALLALLGVSIVLGLLLRSVLASILGLRKGIKDTSVSPQTGRGVKRSIAMLTAAVLWSAVIPGLRLNALPAQFFAKALVIIIVGAFTWLLAAIWELGCDVYTYRSEQNLSKKATHLIIPLVRRFGRFVLLTVGGVFLVSSLGYDVSALVAGLGIGGVALALAAKDSVENLFGSLTIVLDMPFAVGDWIKMDKIDGVVEEINLRSTRIRTFDDSLITLPNSNLIKASVENMGARRFRRFRSQILVSSINDTEGIQKFLDAGRAMLATNPKVRQSDASIRVNDISDAGLRIQVTAYLDVATAEEELEQREALILGLVAASATAGVNMGVGVPPSPVP